MVIISVFRWLMAVSTFTLLLFLPNGVFASEMVEGEILSEDEIREIAESVEGSHMSTEEIMDIIRESNEAKEDSVTTFDVIDSDIICTTLNISGANLGCDGHITGSENFMRSDLFIEIRQESMGRYELIRTIPQHHGYDGTNIAIPVETNVPTGYNYRVRVHGHVYWESDRDQPISINPLLSNHVTIN